MSELDEARSHFEQQWRRMRASIGSELGGPKVWNWRWAALITAVAGGVALGLAWKRKRVSRIGPGYSRSGRRQTDAEDIRLDGIEGE